MLRTLATSLVALTCSNPVFAQHHAGDMRLGKIILRQADAEPLRYKVPAPDVMTQVFGAEVDANFEFFSRVGGIGFNSVAQNTTEFKPAGVTLSDHDDELRLEVVFESEGQSHALLIDAPIWQVAPIIAYARSEHTACFTLFGNLRDGVHPPFSWVVNYHSSFKDTLLGLRLMQADLIAFHSEAIGAPRIGQEFILGDDEQAPDLDANRMRFQQYMAWFDDQPIEYQSYVITDRADAVQIVEKDGILQLLGWPTWLYWRAGDDLEVWINERLQIEIVNDLANLDPGALHEKWTDAGVSKRAAELREEFREKKQPRVHVHQEFSDEASGRIVQMDGICPIAFRPLVNTMRISALVRYLDSQDPSLVDGVLAQLDQVVIEPGIDTPEILDWSPLVLAEGEERSENGE